MSVLTDTSFEAEAIQLKLLRQAPSWQKLQMMAQLNQTARSLALAGLRQRYPQATPAQLRRHLADLLLGETLAAQAYGPPGAKSSDCGRGKL
jgi:alkylation response protein AidB-like acyl-CoA dehydrogenase